MTSVQAMLSCTDVRVIHDKGSTTSLSSDCASVRREPSTATTRCACQEPALYRPVNGVARNGWRAEAQECQRPEHQFVVAHTDDRQGQGADRLCVAVPQPGSAELIGKCDRGCGRDPSRIPGDHTHIFVSVMARLEFAASVIVKTTPERAFDYFADYRHVGQVLEGVSRWAPIGAKTQGVGARYSVEMAVLAFPLKNTLRLDRWRRPDEIGWVSESGLIKQEGGFTFTEVPQGVQIGLRIAYEPPASVIGAAVAHRLDGMVRERLEGAMERIRERLEG